MKLFALLATAWYGSGLFCEDRRAGAHQLYFARPITRLDYFLGKFLVAAFFGACAILVPALVICLVASFSSPEWSFLKEEGDLVFPESGACSQTVESKRSSGEQNETQDDADLRGLACGSVSRRDRIWTFGFRGDHFGCCPPRPSRGDRCTSMSAAIRIETRA